MKLDARRLDGFLRDPGACRVVVLIGDDDGLIRERADTLVKSVAGALDDPFRVVQLDGGASEALRAEAASLSLTGGRRVVRVRDGSAGVMAALVDILSAPGSALVVVEAADLARGKARSALEAAANAAVIACYHEDGAALTATIRATLEALDVGVEAEALRWLATRLGADRLSTRRELEKLALYVGPGGRADLDDAMACVGDFAALSLDDGMFAATIGDVAGADRALEQALSEGASAVGVLRIGQAHVQRLQRARLTVDDGIPPDEAAKALRPPLFFRRVGPFIAALNLWSSAALSAALAGLVDAERACKRTGAADGVIARQAILALARRSAAASA